jgi:hypothetical protein
MSHLHKHKQKTIIAKRVKRLTGGSEGSMSHLKPALLFREDSGYPNFS